MSAEELTQIFLFVMGPSVSGEVPASMGGKRKSTEEGGEPDANGENSPAQQREAPLGESENGGSGRSSGRARKAVKAYDPSTAFQSPSRKQPGTSPAPTTKRVIIER